jgi:hypothetical protein
MSYLAGIVWFNNTEPAYYVQLSVHALSCFIIASVQGPSPLIPPIENDTATCEHQYFSLCQAEDSKSTLELRSNERSTDGRPLLRVRRTGSCVAAHHPQQAPALGEGAGARAAAAAGALEASGHRHLAPPHGSAPAPSDAGPGAAPRPRDAAPGRRGAHAGGVVQGGGARGDEDARHGVRVAATELHNPRAHLRRPGHYLRAVRGPLAPAPQDRHHRVLSFRPIREQEVGAMLRACAAAAAESRPVEMRERLGALVADTTARAVLDRRPLQGPRHVPAGARPFHQALGRVQPSRPVAVVPAHQSA